MERFWKSVSRTSPTDCWRWLLSCNTSRGGYGCVKWCGRVQRAHRVAYSLHHGVTLTADQHVLHSCDNPVCCNPAHLRIGTPADNMRDKVEKNRQTKGAEVWCSRLTDEQVREIRKSKETQRSIAKRFGVGQATICDIRTGKTWKHVPDEE